MIRTRLITLLLLAVTLSLDSFSQAIVADGEVTHFYRIDSSSFKVTGTSTESFDGDKYIVSVDTTNIDTIDFAYTPAALFEKRGDVVFLTKDVGSSTQPSYELYSTSLASGNNKLLIKSRVSFAGLIKNKLYGASTLEYDENDGEEDSLPAGSEAGVPSYALRKKLVCLDLASGNEEVVFDTQDVLQDFFGEIYQLYFSPLSSSIFIVVGDTEDGAIYYDFQYYLFNADDGSASEVFPNNLSEGETKYGVNYGDLYPDYSTGRYLISTEGFILDENFQRVDKVLKRNRNALRGYNYREDTIVSSNLSSRLDTKEDRWTNDPQRVIINFSASYNLEKVLYAIYRNQELSFYDVESLSQEQLQLAKNMVFARHNYQFSSYYYQAFFNLFDFYNTEEKRKTRTKTMEGKLSYHDHRNLELLKRYIRK